jgi:hypothetical protein
MEIAFFNLMKHVMQKKLELMTTINAYPKKLSELTKWIFSDIGIKANQRSMSMLSDYY